MSIPPGRDDVTQSGRAAAVALAGLLVLSGCSTAGVGSDTPTETVTPAPVPEQTPDVRLAPGLTRDGVTRPLVLAGTHSRAIGERYVLRTDWTVRSPDGTLVASSRQRVRSTSGAFLVRFRLRGHPGFLTNGEPMDAAFWTNGSTLVGRTQEGNDTDYRYLSAGLYEGGGAGFYRSLRRPKPWRDHRALFSAVETRVAGRQEGPTGTAYVVVGERVRASGTFAAATGVEDPRNVSLRAVVTEAGIVRELRLQYEGVHPFRGRVAVVRTVTYSEIDTVGSVPRPDWVDDAITTEREDRRDRDDRRGGPTVDDQLAVAPVTLPERRAADG